MHDPLCVAFEIRWPWPKRERACDPRDGTRWKFRFHHDHHDDCAPDCPDNPFPWWRPGSYVSFPVAFGRAWHFPRLVTVWHREPGNRDSGEVCKHYRRWEDADGVYHTKFLGGWRWHVWHWRIQVPPLQELRRTLLTRCAWCGGRSRNGDGVNISHSWDGPRGRWWQGAPGLFHRDCSMVERAHAACLCAEPNLAGKGHGQCQECGKFRPYGPGPGEGTRMLAELSPGDRIQPDMWDTLKEAWARDRATSRTDEE